MNRYGRSGHSAPAHHHHPLAGDVVPQRVELAAHAVGPVVLMDVGADGADVRAGTGGTREERDSR